MQIIFIKDSKTLTHLLPVARIKIYPGAEGGQGIIQLYGEDEKLMHSVVLQDLDSVTIEEHFIPPALAVLIPPPEEYKKDEEPCT